MPLFLTKSLFLSTTWCYDSVIASFFKVKETIFFQVAELKAHMPMEMLRMIKRTFKNALGKHINNILYSKSHIYIIIHNNLKLPTEKLCTLSQDQCNHCAVPENIHTHTNKAGLLEIPGGGVSTSKQIMKQNWKTVISIQRGGRCSNRKPFVGGVGIFSGTIHLKNDIRSTCIIHITYISCKVKIGKCTFVIQ